MGILDLFKRQQPPQVYQPAEEGVLSKWSRVLHSIHSFRGGYERVSPINNLEQIAKEGYSNPTIAWCVDFIADEVASLPLEIKLQSMQKHEPFDKESLQRYPHLRGLINNTTINGRLGNEAMSLRDYLLYGIAYEHAVQTYRGISEIYRIPPGFITPVVGKYGYPKHYEINGYGIQGGAQFTIPSDPKTGKSEVLFHKNYHPSDLTKATAAAQKAYREVNTMNQISEVNYSLTKNRGVPSGVFHRVNQDRPITPNEYERLKEGLDARFTGDNAGKPLLTGDFQFQPIAMTPREGEYVATRESMIRDILAQYRIPAQLYGLPDSQTYSNQQEARLAFYLRAVLPVARLFWERRSLWVSLLLNEDISIQPCDDNIPVIADWRLDRMQKIDTLEFLTINEKRQQFGLQPVVGGDVMLTDSGKQTLEDTVMGNDDDDEDGDDEDGDGDKNKDKDKPKPKQGQDKPVAKNPKQPAATK